MFPSRAQINAMSVDETRREINEKIAFLESLKLKAFPNRHNSAVENEYYVCVCTAIVELHFQLHRLDKV